MPTLQKSAIKFRGWPAALPCRSDPEVINRCSTVRKMARSTSNSNLRPFNRCLIASLIPICPHNRLYVPFLTSVVGLPMFVVAGSALSVLIGMIFAIFNFMVLKGVQIHWTFIGVELIGNFMGSMIGPRTGKCIPNKVLKGIFIVLAVYIGVRYTVRGFFGIALL
ncbi:MAG: sulfite exporter TauE/SafE family protein [Deltaproteobacteria bacterium]|nr:sulfite exporter TauE/SafE family protein [Deltaproteobacteria bacterium]MBW2041549.1 sulfite exporter TauE/SafE family protein [Deltaproteobacteria bacterium]